MKSIVIVIILFIFSLNIAKAQTDYCKDITKKHDVEMGLTSYYSPLLTHLGIGKDVSDNNPTGGTISLSFYATKKTADYNAGGLYVTFDDGSIWKDEGHSVDCSYLNSDFGYSYSASKLLHTDALMLFKTKKIIKIRISDIEIPIDDAFAVKFEAWANCIEAIK